VLVIAGASSAETKGIIKKTNPLEQQLISGTVWTRGIFAGQEISIVQTGVGLRKAKTAAIQIVKKIFPSFVLLIGAGGAVDSFLNCADVVIIKNILRKQGPIHDRSLTDIAGSFHCHQGLSHMAYRLLKQAGLSAVWGDCLTTERFIHQREEKEWIAKTFHAKVVEMESAAMAKVFSEAGIPLLSARIVADTAKTDTVDYEELILQRRDAGRLGVAWYLLKKPYELYKLIQLQNDMVKVRKRIMKICQIVVSNLPIPLPTNQSSML
jgi:nucleoside phosphorylase